MRYITPGEETNKDSIYLGLSPKEVGRKRHINSGTWTYVDIEFMSGFETSGTLHNLNWEVVFTLKRILSGTQQTSSTTVECTSGYQ